MRADRLLSLVLLLQCRGRLTAAQLAAQLDVSVRTIYRDVVALGIAGIPVYADPGGYRLVGGYRTQLTGLTAQEARGLVLAGLPQAATDLGLARVVAAARLKVDAALPDVLRDQVDRMRQRFHLDAPGWYHDGDSSDHLTRLAEAVWQQQVIEVTYESWTRTLQVAAVSRRAIGASGQGLRLPVREAGCGLVSRRYGPLSLKVVAPLQVEPEPLGGTEVAGESQGSVGH